MKSKQSCPRGQGLPNLKTEASSPQLARKRYFDAPSNPLIRLTFYYSLNRWALALFFLHNGIFYKNPELFSNFMQPFLTLFRCRKITGV